MGAWLDRWYRLGFVALLVTIGACAPEEHVTVSPETTTRTITAGSSDQVPMSVLLDDSGFQFVGLPADVRMIGLDSDVDGGLSLHADPIEVTIDERESAQNAVVTVSVLPGTPPGEYHARIVPDSATEFLEGGEGLELVVIVPPGGAVEPTSSLTPLPTQTPSPTFSPIATPTECDDDFDDCECDPDFEDCDGDGIIDDDE